MSEIATPKKGLTFDHDSHTYYFDGKRVPNVTSLLKDYGLISFDGIPQERLDYKRALGVAVHYAAFLFDKNDLDEDSMDKRIKPYFEAYKKFREISGFEPRHSELKMYSKVFRFAGTLDLQGILMYKGRESESIIDIKCSWEVYPSSQIQLSGYKILFEENYKTRIRRLLVLQLKENGNYELTEYEDKRYVFLSTVMLHQWKEENLKNANNNKLQDL